MTIAIKRYLRDNNEEGATKSERALFEEFISAYPNGKPEPIVENQPVIEPIDEEKVAMAEAIIDMEIRLSALETV